MLVASTSFVGLLPPPALGERRHRGLARRGVAVHRDATDQAMLLKSRAGDEGQRHDGGHEK